MRGSVRLIAAVSLPYQTLSEVELLRELTVGVVDCGDLILKWLGHVAQICLVEIVLSIVLEWLGGKAANLREPAGPPPPMQQSICREKAKRVSPSSCAGTAARPAES